MARQAKGVAYAAVGTVDAAIERLRAAVEEVANSIAKTLAAHTPRFRNPVGPFAHLSYFMRGKMPTRLLRTFTKLYLGLPLWPSAPVARSVKDDRKKKLKVVS